MDMRHREPERSVWYVLGGPVPWHAYDRPRDRHVHVALGLRVRGSSPRDARPDLLPVCRSLGTCCAALGIGTCDLRLTVEAWHSLYRRTFHTSSPFVRTAGRVRCLLFVAVDTVTPSMIYMPRAPTWIRQEETRVGERRSASAHRLYFVHMYALLSPSRPRGSWLRTCFKGPVWLQHRPWTSF